METWGNPRQLYTLIHDLSQRIRNHNDLSSVTGFSIVNALADFDFYGDRKIDLRVQEVSVVYSGLEQARDMHKEYGTDTLILAQEKDLQPHLSVRPRLEDVRSTLLTDLYKNMEPGHGTAQNQLVNRATRLIHGVYDKGPQKKQRGVELEDYYALQRYFTGKKPR